MSLVQTVNARDLHHALGVGKVFAAWIVERIAAFEFSENSDFVVFSETGNNPSGGRPAKEYALTLDMAKELAMVERNEAGKLTRRYFIKAENELRQMRSAAPSAPPALPDFTDPSVALPFLIQTLGRLNAANERAKDASRARVRPAPISSDEIRRINPDASPSPRRTFGNS